MFHRAFRQNFARASASFNANNTRQQQFLMINSIPHQVIVPCHQKISPIMSIVSSLPAEVQQMLLELAEEDEDQPSSKERHWRG